jgi:hypothetical protein
LPARTVLPSRCFRAGLIAVSDFRYEFNYCTDISTGGGPSSDGSGYSYDGERLTSSNGSLVNAPVINQNSSSNILQTTAATITDTNGNVISNNGNGTFTDTLGLTALTISGSGAAASPLNFTYSAPTPSNPAATATVIVSYKTYTVQTNVVTAWESWYLVRYSLKACELAKPGL